MNKIFISYSSKNRKYARIIYKCLKKYFDVWIDEKGLLVGDDFEREISNEIDNRNIYILLLSKEFWESEFIYEKELPKIFSNNFGYIVPVILDNISSLDDKKGSFILNRELNYLNASPRNEIGNLTSIKELGLKKSLEYLINGIKKLPLTETYLKFSLDVLKLLHYECKYEKLEVIEVKENKVLYKLNNREKKLQYPPLTNQSFKEYLVNEFQKNDKFIKIKNKLYKEKYITKAYLNEQFGYIFPVPNKVTKEVFKTTVIEKLLQDIKNKRKVHIIAPAGVGKTSAMKLLKKELSKEKIVIFYDVFGEGNYKENKRYQKEVLLKQITNEIAILAGFEPLENGDFEFYLKKYLDKLNSFEKEVVIIIDAIDNAISALKENGDKNFITDFLKWDLPENVQIIVTSREGARAKIGVELEKIELKPFTIEDTQKFLQLKHIKLKDIKKFRYLTRGIGRVCEYAIKNLDDFMRHNEPVLLENIFQTIYDNATETLLKEEKEIFEILVLLKRPLKVNDIIEIFGFKKEKVIKVIETMKPGMYLENNEVIFKDEDFEKYLEDKIENKTQIHKKIASHLLKNNSIYSQRIIAYHLYNAEMIDELYKISFKEIEIDNEIIKKEILKERIYLALKIAFKEKNYFLISKLLLQALEVKKSEFILEEFIDEIPKLLFLKGIEEGVNSLQSKYKNEELFFLAYYLYDINKEKAKYLYESALNSIKDLSKFTTEEQIEKLAYYLSYQYALNIEKLGKKEILINKNYNIWFELEIIKNLKIDFNLSKDEFKKMHILKQLLIAYLEYKKGNKKYINYIDDEFKLNKEEIDNLFDSYEKDIRDILGIELSEIFLIEGKNHNELLKIFEPKNFKEFYGEHFIKEFKNTIFYYSLFPPNELLLNKHKYKDFLNNLKLIYDFYVLALKDEIDVKARWEYFFKSSFFKDYNNGYKEKYLKFQKHIVLFKIAVLKLRDKIDIVLDRLKKIPWYDFEIIEFLISQKETSLAYQLIENCFEKIINDETTMSEKISELLKLSEIVKRIDNGYANDILKYALELSNKVNDNIYNNFEIIRHLVKTTHLEDNFKKELIITLYNSIEDIRKYSYKFKLNYIVKKIAANLNEKLYLGTCYNLDIDNYKDFSSSFDYFLDKDLTVDEKFAFRYFVNNKRLLQILEDTPLYEKLIDYIMLYEKNDTKYDLLKDINRNDVKEFIEFYEKEFVTKNENSCDFEVTRDNYKELLKKSFGCKKEIFKKLKNILSNKELLDLMFEYIEYDFSYFYEEFFEVLETPVLRRKKQEYIKEAIQQYARYLTSKNWSSLKYYHFFKHIDKKEAVDILIEKNINPFREDIYVENIGYLIEIVSEMLNDEQKIELIKDNIQIITKDIELQNKDIEEIDLVEYLWRFLSHPDKRKRFKAMYVLEDLIYANSSKYLKIIERLDDAKPYENKYILNLSGIWYLLMLLYKISFKNPQILKEIENKLLNFFNSTHHILYKCILKEILINIDEKYKETLKFEAISKSNKLKCKYFYSEKFESLCMRNDWDTIHYWYKRITSIFDIDMQEIIDIADKYLKKWNICIKDLDYQEIHIDLAYYDRDNYFIISNRHGSLPTIEQLDIYLEFHLMFYIVNELLDKKGVCIDRDDFGYIEDRFEEWIERFYITKLPWCSERLSSFPLIRGAFKEINLEEIKNLGGLFILEGKFNNISIYSAFISNKFAYEFTKKVQQYEKKDYYDFAFPGWDYEQEEWIKKGYLTNPYEIIYINHCEIQNDDFLNRSYCYRFETNLEFLKYKEWGEEKNLVFKENTKGYMVYCNKNELLKYLKQNNLTLFRMFVKYKDKKNEFIFDRLEG